MQSITLVEELVENTRELLNTGKKVMIKVAWNLIQIRDSGIWKEQYDSFPKYCQMELDISQGQTSRLKTIGEFFFPHYTPEDIGAISERRLYAAARLPGTVEENLSRAKTWSDDDFKKEVADIQPHTPTWVTYCDVCKLSNTNHP